MNLFPLPYEDYLEIIITESERFALAARTAGLQSPVANCPGWDVAKMILHVGVLQRWVAAMVKDGILERLDFTAIERAPDGEARIVWMEEGSHELVDVLREAGDQRAVWTFEEIGRSSFWARRMAHETMVHRIDLELACTTMSLVELRNIADGIDEYWSAQLGRNLRRGSIFGLTGVLTIRATDVDAEWTVELTDGDLLQLPHNSPADVTVTGPVEELLLFLWNRGTLRTSEVIGDRKLVDAWPEIVRL